jgi:hypothetical protein
MRQHRAIRWALAMIITAGCSPAPRGGRRSAAPTGADPTAADDSSDIRPGAAPTSEAAAGRAGCLPHAEAWQQQRAIEQQNRAAFEAAVGTLGLQLVTLAVEYEELDLPPVPRPGGGIAPRTPWTEYTDARGQQRLAGPHFHSDCPNDTPAPPEFAQADDGMIFRLDPQARSAGGGELRSCGCPVVDMSGMCGAHMPRELQMTFALPAGSRYGGVKDVAYPQRTARITYARQLGTPECPMPQPPP